MTLSDILTLSKAGFNATQISALASIGNGASGVSVPAPTPAPAPALTPAPTPAPAPAPEPAPEPTQYDEILRQLGVINTSVQQSVLSMASQPQQESVDDILATIINPPTIKD